MRQAIKQASAAQAARYFASWSPRKVGLAAAGLFGTLVLLLILAGVGLHVAYAERMYPGVRALGVGLGGQTRAEAQATLERRAGDLANRTISIGHQELAWTVTGEQLGVRKDVQSVAEEAYSLGRQGNVVSRFFQQLSLLFNGPSYEVKTVGDPATLDGLMEVLARAVDRPITDARLAVSPEGVVDIVGGLPGRRLEIEPTRARLEEALARPDITSVPIVVEETAAAITPTDLAAARAQAETLLSAPMLFKFEDAQWELSVQQLAAMAKVNPREGVTLDPEAVKAWAARLAKEVDQAPQNARFTWSAGTLSLLRAGREGRRVDVEQTVQTVMEKTLVEDRNSQLPVTVTKPDITQEDGPKLGIRGLIESARTSYTSASPPKAHNIALAAQRLNGVVVAPGKLFSFNREVGSTSLDTGYRLGWGIANAGGSARTVPAVAGGICQVATTLFHSVFWAGYQIEERNTHLYWIPSYTTRGIVGLDATVDEDAELDFSFYNNTDSYLLIQAWTEGASVVFGLYGTKPNWTVKVTPGERTDVVEASKDQVIQDEPSLPLGQRLAVEGAQDGFKITNVRTVTRGNDSRTLRLSSLYRPSRNVTVVGTGGRPAGPSQVIANQATRPADATPVPRSTAAAGQPTSTPATGAAKPTSQAAPAGATPAPTTAPAAKPTVAPTRQAAPTPTTRAATPAATNGR